MTELYDAAIVGAGPAGSAAAVVLARAGQRVALLDRQTFPRDKPCGDLIGARAVSAALRLGLDPAVLDEFPHITGAAITADGGGLDLFPETAVGRRLLAGSDARVVPRMVFDRALVELAVRSGAEFRVGTVRAVGKWSGESRLVDVVAAGSTSEVAARVVIVAGGYGCRVAAELASTARDDGPPRGIAMRGYFQQVQCPADRIVFSLDRWLLPGYGWVFPLPNGGANIGVGRLVGPGASGEDGLQSLWQRYTEDDGSPVAGWLRDAGLVGEPRAWPLDLGPRRRRLVADGLLAVGEAAGFVGPLTGAGIAFALESGERAGATAAAALTAGDVSRDRLRPYAAAMRRRLAPWLRAELLAQQFLADADRTERLFDIIRPLPLTGVVGARLLLHLG